MGPSDSPETATARRDRLAGLTEHRLVMPLGALLVVLFLLPMLHAPFAGDDVYVSEVAGYADVLGRSWWTELWELVKEMVVTRGRPQPLASFYGPSMMHLLGDHAAAYHAYILLLTALAAYLLGVLLIRLGLSRSTAFLAIVLGTAFVQFRRYHDSMQSYVGLIQILMILTFLSLLAFQRYLEGGRRKDLVLSVLVFLPAPLLYEVAYPFVALHLGLALLDRRGRAAVRAAAPLLALGIGFVVLSYVMRANAQTDPEGYYVGGGPWAIVRTYFLQLFPPLPTSSILFDPGAVAGGVTKPELLAATWRGALTGILAVACVWTAVKRPAATAARAVPAAIVVGLGLWFVPPLLLSLAPKYQTELGAGRGYLVVLMQGFGVAVLLALGAVALARRAALRSGHALALALVTIGGLAALGGGVTGFNNIRVVAVQQPIAHTRDVVEAAADRGAFKQLPGDPTLFFLGRDLGWTLPPLFEAPWASIMLAQRDGRIFDTRLQDTNAAEPPLNCPRGDKPIPSDCAPVTGSAAWVRIRVRARERGGSVLIAPLDRVRVSGYRNQRVTDLIAYTEGPEKLPPPPRIIGLRTVTKAWDSAKLQWTELRHGDGWALYRTTTLAGDRPLVATIDDALGAVDFQAAIAPAQQAAILGTKNLLP